MNYQELKQRLHELDEEWCTTIRYHQLYAWWYGLLDRVVRVAVSLLTVIDLALPGNWKYLSSYSLLFVAMVLNIIPLSEWQHHHRDLFRKWIDLRKRLLVMSVKIQKNDDTTTVTDPILKKLERFHLVEQAITADEPQPRRKILIRCQGDEIESRFGTGIRTPEAARKSREHPKEGSN